LAAIHFTARYIYAKKIYFYHKKLAKHLHGTCSLVKS